MTSRQIENYNLGEICFCITNFKTIRLLPGINLVDEQSFSELEQHPAFKDYLRIGTLEEIHIDTNDFVIDQETQITIMETDNEKIPIQNVMVNAKSEPLAKNGVFISPSQAKKAGLSQEVANRISQFAPPTGWASVEQLRTRLDLSDEVDLSKLPFPEVIANMIVTEEES